MIRRILLVMLSVNIINTILDIVAYRKEDLTLGDFFKKASKERSFLIVQLYILAIIAFIVSVAWIVGGDTALKYVFEFVKKGWDYDQTFIH